MTRNDTADSQPTVVLTDDTLTIEGEEISVKHRRMPLEDVRLDPTNPRIQHAVKQTRGNGSISQDDLRKLILDQPGVSELFKSIRDNKGLLEPIFIRPDGRIIEGNCRAASYMKLHSIDKKDQRWQTIRAVFVPNITDRQVAILQGHYHISGKNKWLAYEKAGHLHAMKDRLGMNEKVIAQALGMHERDVIRDLKAYETMTEKLLPKMKSGGLDKWSFVQEFYKRKDLEEYRSKPTNEDEFVKMVVDKKIKRGTDVRKLAKILEHPKAVKVLRKTDIDNAMSIVGKADPTADSTAFKTLKHATTLLNEFPQSELQRLRENGKSRAILQNLFAAIKVVAKAAEVKLS